MTQATLRRKTEVLGFFKRYENWLVKGKRAAMPPLKGVTPCLTLYPLYQRRGGGHCNSDQHYQMQPATVIIEDVLEMPALALSPLLSYKLEIKNLFRNKTMLHGGETQVSHDV